MTDTAFDVAPLGDSALLVTLGHEANPALTRRAHAVAATIERVRASTPGLGRPIPAHASVLVPLDVLVLERSAATAAVTAAARDALMSEASDPAPVEPVEIEVRYGGDDGPDLEEVAARVGLSPADVVELHASARYVVLFLGFAPGFAYLGGLPDALVTPRRATPRQRVVAGSVAIAGGQTAIYPRSMPGGWNLIGRTEATLFDPMADPPARLSPGALVRFGSTT